MKFKVGDVVEVVRNGYGCSPLEVGRTVTIGASRFEGYGRGDEHGYKVIPPIGNTISGDYDGWIGESSFKLHRPKGRPKIYEGSKLKFNWLWEEK